MTIPACTSDGDPAARRAPAARNQAGREWRQFRLLSRDSVRRLLDAALLSRDADPMPFALWVVALAAMPPAMYAVRRLMPQAASAVVPSEAASQIVLGHRMFFVVYAMTACALLASLMWETLLPDRTDQEIVGALPVRPRTMAAARLSAAVFVVLAFSAAIAVPSGLLVAVSSSAPPRPDAMLMAFAAHVAAVMAGGVFVFLALLSLRGLVAAILGPGAADRLALALQLLTVAGLVEVLFYLPSVLPLLGRRMLLGDSLAMMLPPVWFAALYSVLGGAREAGLVLQAGLGVLALCAAAAVVIPVYLVPARTMARRALASQTRQRTGALSGVVRTGSRMLARTPPVRGMLQFTAATLTRSRPHLLVLVSYAGVGTAIALIGVLAAGIRRTPVGAEPAGVFLAAPLVLIFFVVAGVRAACTVPAEPEANWPFRLAPPSVRQTVAALRLALLALAVLPVVAAAAAAAAFAGWPAGTVLAVAAFNALAGWLMVECSVAGWRKVPVASTHTPSIETVRTRWLLYAIPFVAFTVIGSAMQAAALRSAAGAVSYVGATMTAVAIVRLWSARQAERQTVVFDPLPHPDVQTLGLSEAVR